jgi:UDP-2,3-diacylglucosamine hydrolase
VILYVSDLHLCSSRPEINRIFFDFLAGPARRAQALYILGDLFEYWAGDDDLSEPFNASVAGALAQYAQSRPLYLMRGNRDFLIGERFGAATGAKLIDEPARIEIEGTPTLLAHGDTLCTDDLEYQRFRAEVRSTAWIEAFLATPLAARKREIKALRSRSEREKRVKSAAVMEVNVDAVAMLLRAHGYPRLIHGHTHRPAQHIHEVDGRRCERWVLADWYAGGSALCCDAFGCRTETIS